MLLAFAVRLAAIHSPCSPTFPAVMSESITLAPPRKVHSCTMHGAHTRQQRMRTIDSAHGAASIGPLNLRCGRSAGSRSAEGSNLAAITAS